MKKEDALCFKINNDCLVASKGKPHAHQIFEILLQLKRLNLDREQNPTSRSDAFNIFNKWISGNVDLTKINVHRSSFGMGVFAAKDIQMNEIITSLPPKYALKVSSSPFLSEAFKYDNSVKKNSLNLCLLLLYEKFCNEHSSDWKQYIDILPSQFTTPLYFDDHNLEQATDLISFQSICKHIIIMAQQFLYIKGYLTNVLKKDPKLKKLIKNFTWNNFRWAVSCLSTRQNLIILKDKTISHIETNDLNESTQSKDISHELALIPILDMFNHDGNVPMSIDQDPMTGNILIYAPKSYKKGDEIFINYGKNRSSSEFLIHNGFVPDHVDNDYILIPFGLNKNDPFLTQKLALIQKIVNDNEILKHNHQNLWKIKLSSTDPLITWEDFSILRAICLTPDIFSQLSVEQLAKQFAQDDLNGENSSILNKNVSKTYAFLKGRCQIYLKKHKIAMEKFANCKEKCGEIDIVIDKLYRHESRILQHAIDALSTKM